MLHTFMVVSSFGSGVKFFKIDALFFLDLPTFRERREIFSVHLLKRRPVIEPFDLERLARASEGYVGAEIEQSIVSAMVMAFNEGQREFTTEDIMTSLKEIVPLSKSQGENIKRLRIWLDEGKARSASFPEKDAAIKEQVKIIDYGAPLPIEVGGKE